METKNRKGTLSDAIDAVSTLDIVEEFDIPHKTQRGRTYLLCPGHDDRHFGSCYVDKNDNGYYCYVCGEHVTKWQMVLQLNGNKKSDACEWFFKMSGITPIEENRDDPYKKALQLIRRLEQYVHNDVVYNDTHACDKIDSSYGRNINGEYLYSDLTITNPLMELYKTNKNVFKDVVCRVLDKEIQKLSQTIAFYKEHADDCLYVESVGLVPYSDLATACESVRANIDDLVLSVNKL